MRLTRKKVDIYGKPDYQLRCMYAECCGYILMSASALCIHVGMSACFARPFVHQSVASARLSVRLMIVCHCARRFIFRPSICLIFCPSVCMFVCMYVHMYLCRGERTSVCTVDIENWIDLTDTLSGLSLHWTLILFSCYLFRVAVQTTALPVCAPFYATTVFTIAKKSTHIFHTLFIYWASPSQGGGGFYDIFIHT